MEVKKLQVNFILKFNDRPKGFYVYMHRSAIDGSIFYVGKGRNYRYKSTEGRNRNWKDTASLFPVNVEIVKDNLLETDAFNLERQLILKYGRKIDGGSLVNIRMGGEGSSRAGVRKEYIFINHWKNKEFVATASEFCCETGLSPYNIITGNATHVDRWHIGCKGDTSIIYKFTNNRNDQRFKGTVHEFIKANNWEPYIVLSGRKKVSRGWSIEQSYY